MEVPTPLTEKIWFSVLVGVVILSNAIIIGIQTDAGENAHSKVKIYNITL